MKNKLMLFALIASMAFIPLTSKALTEAEKKELKWIEELESHRNAVKKELENWKKICEKKTGFLAKEACWIAQVGWREGVSSIANVKYELYKARHNQLDPEAVMGW